MGPVDISGPFVIMEILTGCDWLVRSWKDGGWWRTAPISVRRTNGINSRNHNRALYRWDCLDVDQDHRWYRELVSQSQEMIERKQKVRRCRQCRRRISKFVYLCKVCAGIEEEISEYESTFY